MAAISSTDHLLPYKQNWYLTIHIFSILFLSLISLGCVNEQKELQRKWAQIEFSLKCRKSREANWWRCGVCVRFSYRFTETNVCSDRNWFLRFLFAQKPMATIDWIFDALNTLQWLSLLLLIRGTLCNKDTFAINIFMYTNDWTAAIFRFRFLSINKFKQFFPFGRKTLQYFFRVFFRNHINMFHFFHTFWTYFMLKFNEFAHSMFSHNIRCLCCWCGCRNK